MRILHEGMELMTENIPAGFPIALDRSVELGAVVVVDRGLRNLDYRCKWNGACATNGAQKDYWGYRTLPSWLAEEAHHHHSR